MNRMDELIAEYCPKGVEFKTLGDVGTIFGGLTGKSKADFSNGNARFVSYVNVFNNIAVKVDTNDFVKVEAGERQRALQRGDILFTGSSETANEVGMSSVLTAQIKEPLYLNSFCIGYRFNESSMLDPDFSKYLFRSDEVRKQLVRTASGVTRFNVSKSKLAQVKIPTPPLEVQREIVKVLDAFTQLEAELEAELEARRRQYQYYRDALLTFGERTDADANIRWTTLGSICKSVSSGGTPLSTRADYYGGNIPWLRTQEVRYADILDTEIKITEKGLKESSAKWIPANCVIVAISGATAARSAINKIPMTTNQHCCNLEIDPEQANFRYVFHWVSKEYETLKSFGQGARADLNSGLIKSFPIPVPSLEEQARIVAILDKFDALVNDVSSGLPAEIAARRQQYEHYRDRLLTFKEAA